MEIALTCAVVIAGVGWFKRYISTTALIYYMKKSGYKLPDDQEMEECTLFVARNLFR